MATVSSRAKVRRRRNIPHTLANYSTVAPLARPVESGIGLRERLGESELRRRFWHMAPGTLPLILWEVNHGDPISPLLKTIFIVTIGLLGGLIFVFFRLIAREGEQVDRAGAVLGYACSVLATLFLFPHQAELGLTVLAVLSFGDGSATLFGKLFRGRKLPWNPQKTWTGLAAFIVVGSTWATAIYWGETYFNAYTEDPPPGLLTAIVCGTTATVLAAMAESVKSRINDNIRVGVTAAVGVVAAHAMIVGF